MDTNNINKEKFDEIKTEYNDAYAYNILINSAMVNKTYNVFIPGTYACNMGNDDPLKLYDVIWISSNPYSFVLTNEIGVIINDIKGFTCNYLDVAIINFNNIPNAPIKIKRYRYSKPRI